MRALYSDDFNLSSVNKRLTLHSIYKMDEKDQQEPVARLGGGHFGNGPYPPEEEKKASEFEVKGIRETTTMIEGHFGADKHGSSVRSKVKSATSDIRFGTMMAQTSTVDNQAFQLQQNIDMDEEEMLNTEVPWANTDLMPFDK